MKCFRITITNLNVKQRYFKKNMCITKCVYKIYIWIWIYYINIYYLFIIITTAIIFLSTTFLTTTTGILSITDGFPYKYFQ